MTINIPEILLPDGCDMGLWAVNACDQFTSDAAYWHNLENLVGNRRSALHLIFPEIYLKQNPAARIAKINKTMRDYLSEGVFKSLCGGFVLVERTTRNSGTRTGIVLAVDLEDYSFSKGAKTLIRSTEETVAERIPARVEIRKGAPVELPHAMLLYNDRENKVLNGVKRGEVLYDFDLNMDGGHVKGTFITNPQEIISLFNGLISGDFLFAVGDGNHSLAAAKTCWENLKPTLTQSQKQTHPARFALCEVVNVYDPALNFEPIHRYLKTDFARQFVQNLNLGSGGKAVVCADGREIQIDFDGNIPAGIRRLDALIAKHIQTYGGEVDYIHGESQLKSLAQQGGVGILLPAIDKSDFFELIERGGNLPRKTFSMGEGNEKRYYIEAKKI